MQTREIFFKLINSISRDAKNGPKQVADIQDNEFLHPYFTLIYKSMTRMKKCNVLYVGNLFQFFLASVVTKDLHLID